MTERRDERPAKIIAPNYEETAIAQKPGVAEDNEERTRFDRTAKNSENQTVKEWSKGWTKRMAARKTLYWAHGGDADHAIGIIYEVSTVLVYFTKLPCSSVLAPCC